MNTSPEKLFCFAAKHSLSHLPTSSKLLKCRSASACPIDAKRSDVTRPKDYGGGGRMSHASDFKVSFPVLMCETGHCRVTKSFFHVPWPILVVFRSMCDLD